MHFRIFSASTKRRLVDPSLSLGSLLVPGTRWIGKVFSVSARPYMSGKYSTMISFAHRTGKMSIIIIA